MRDFSRAAATYDTHAVLQRHVADYLFSIVKEKLESRSFVLDIGCGTGYFHELLRKNKIYCPLVQADIAFAMCQKSAEYASPPEYGGTYTLTADMEALPLASGSLDHIFSSLTLQWAADRAQALQEARRVLKPGGTLALSTIGQGSLRELAACFAELDDHPHVYEEHFLHETALVQGLNEGGFRDPMVHSKTHIQHYPDLKSLLQSLKGIGASYKASERRPYPGKGYFVQLERIYRERFGTQAGLPVSWNILYGVGRSFFF